jgi:uncharacterized membrane protein YoaK (UPF0700 family)
MAHTRLCSSWFLPAILSTTAGAVDVIGFLALGGLFTAHITGNVVIVAAHYVTGGFSQVGPILAVPIFMAVMGLVTLASGALVVPNEGAQITSFALWQCNFADEYRLAVVKTPILIIFSLTILLFGFDSGSRNESNRFRR